MPVATMLAIAASFWSNHGYPIASNQVTWEWTTVIQTSVSYSIQAYVIGRIPNHIFIDRRWWDRSTKLDKCVVLIHEDGHAALRFEDIDDASGNIMNIWDDKRKIPGTCMRKHWA